MRFTVICDDEPIGYVELDPSEKFPGGDLEPLPAFERIRPLLEQRDHAQLDTLFRLMYLRDSEFRQAVKDESFQESLLEAERSGSAPRLELPSFDELPSVDEIPPELLGTGDETTKENFMSMNLWSFGNTRATRPQLARYLHLDECEAAITAVQGLRLALRGPDGSTPPITGLHVWSGRLSADGRAQISGFGPR
jgi:hypothetical protein